MKIAQFVNMFGGDYFDWTKEKIRSNSVPHDLVANKKHC